MNNHYYIYKGATNELVDITTASYQSGRGSKANPTILPMFDGGAYADWGREEVPPIDYSILSKYEQISETHANCVNFKVRNIAGKGFNFHNKTDKSKFGQFEKMLNKTNERGESLYEVVNKFVGDYIRCGQAFFEVVGKEDYFNLYNSAPQNFRIMLNKYGNKPMYYGYNITSINKRNFIKAYRDVNKTYFRFLHSLSNPNSFSQFYGMPEWYSGIQSMEINFAIDTWIQSFMNNNARFDFLLVTTGQQLNPDQETKIKNTLTGGKGVENAGKGGYLSVDYDTKVQVIQLNNVNHKSFFDGKGEYIQQIIQAHGLSEHSAGFSKGGNSIAGNEATGALRKDAETYILPTQVKIENNINKLFYQISGYNPDFRFIRMDVVSDKEKAVIRDADVTNRIAPPSYFTRTTYPDLTNEELAELEELKKKDTEKKDTINFQEKPDSFDDTQNYERSDRR